jgi:hypothetical protein
MRTKDLDIVRGQINKACPNQTPVMYVTQRLIMDSAYWYMHPNGPAKAPAHQNNITTGPHGLQIEFGANKFLVGMALKNCCAHLLKVMTRIEKDGHNPTSEEVVQELQLIVRRCVANFEDTLYPTHWKLTNGHMQFGAQSIHLGEFVRSYCLLMRLVI